jgi:hypothetical protein
MNKALSMLTRGAFLLFLCSDVAFESLLIYKNGEKYKE